MSYSVELDNKSLQMIFKGETLEVPQRLGL